MSDIQEPLPWGKSSATVAVLEQLVADRLLPRNSDAGAPAWISPHPDESEPKPPQGYIVSFVRLHERGFGVPVSKFMRALCEYYGVELHNFSPNSISQAAVFVAVCEGYLGIDVHWDLWIHLFRGELFVENARNQPRRFARAGGLMLHVRPNRRNLYITSKTTTNNSGWSRGWFYLRNFSGALPAFTNKVLRERPAKWDWGVSPPAQQARLEDLTDALARLARKGLRGRHRELSPAEGDPPRGEGPADLPTHPRKQGRGLEDVEQASFPHQCCPKGEVRGGGFSPRSRGSVEDQDAPRAGVYFPGEFWLRIRRASCSSFP